MTVSLPERHASPVTAKCTVQMSPEIASCWNRISALNSAVPCRLVTVIRKIKEEQAMKTLLYGICLAVVALLLIGAVAMAGEYQGTAKIGFVGVDDEGARGVNQPTYNLYEGLGLSLQDFSYRFDNGTRIYGNLRDVTLNNRNLFAGVTRPGLFGFTIKNNQYRRIYFTEFNNATRRQQTNAHLWVEPYKYLRVFGGYGYTGKSGERALLRDPGLITPVDYTHEFFNAGFRLKYERSYAQFEWRGSDFSDNENRENHRETSQFRITAFSPVPRVKNLIVNAGLLHYAVERSKLYDSLFANTFWGGARYFFKGGYSLRYSFIWDRARRTGDLTSTDNISHAIYADKVWPQKAGITIGYRYKINDDLLDELQTNSYHFAAWLKASPRFTFKAGYGSDNVDVTGGSTLTGDEERTNLYGSVQYRSDYGTARLRYDNKQKDNDEIGSSADFNKVGGDIWTTVEKYGELRASYSYLSGEYKNREGRFEFRDHVVSGDIYSPVYKGVRGGFGGTYMRSKEDVDVEKSQLRFSGTYSFADHYKAEIIYRAYNFDDYDDPSPVYSQYYTANVVEISLYYEF
jgi:hypothetical protein